MSELEDHAAADGNGGVRKTRDDPWMSTVVNVSGFLAGFSLATVVVISDAPEHFRWPGVAALALTIGAVVLVGAAQFSRRGAYYSEEFRRYWRDVVWVMYHGGTVALFAGLGAALVPLEGKAGQAGVAGQQDLRWAAACVAFAATFGEVVFTFRTPVKRVRNREKLAGLLQGRDGWQAGTQGGERCWYFGTGGARRLVITPKTEGYLIYRAGQDCSWVIQRTELDEQWLGKHERAGLPQYLEVARRDLGEREAGFADT